ncbi:hypothetical protein ACH347_14705 [Saccharopolyspora sp. 5N102]|uniref:hypothetical protein n=1 Tax=Saccharopolyspora sp. 5N102 TaxID=3375155 RepID=UPI0037BBCE08
MPDNANSFMKYLESLAQERKTTIYDLGFRSSVVDRWRREYRPDIGNCRIIAERLDVNLLEVLVAAGRLTFEEATATIGRYRLSHIIDPETD